MPKVLTGQSWRLFAIALAVAATARAESGFYSPPAANPPANGAGAQPGQTAAGGQAPAGPSVFDLQKPSGPKTTKSSTSGTERFYGDDPDYNTAQREQWIQSCEAEKNKSMEDFRRCYQERKKGSNADLRRRFDRVERNLGQPLGAPDRAPRLPSGDVGGGGLPPENN